MYRDSFDGTLIRSLSLARYSRAAPLHILSLLLLLLLLLPLLLFLRLVRGTLLLHLLLLIDLRLFRFTVLLFLGLWQAKLTNVNVHPRSER